VSSSVRKSRPYAFFFISICPPRAGGGYLVAVSAGVNRSFQTFFEDFRKFRISPKKPPLRALEPKLRLRRRAVGRCSGYEHFDLKIKDLRPIFSFRFARPRAGGGYL
jgi:hypothetical protein